MDMKVDMSKPFKVVKTSLKLASLIGRKTLPIMINSYIIGERF